MSSKLLKKGANKRIATVDRNIGVVCPITRIGLEAVRFGWLTTAYSRFLLDSCPMAATSYVKHAMKLLSGGGSTKLPSPPLPSPIAWAATFKHTPSTLVSGRLASLRSSGDGIARLEQKSMDKLVLDLQLAPEARRKVRSTVARSST